jgi:hypothetical protein
MIERFSVPPPHRCKSTAAIGSFVDSNAHAFKRFSANASGQNLLF